MGRPPRTGDVVEAEWIDSEHIALGWAEVSRYVKAARHRQSYRTAGYWLYGDDSTVVVALSTDPFNRSATHVMSIPRCAITKIIVLGRADKRTRKALKP